MVSLTIMVCTLGIPVALGPDYKHCYFYDVEISVSAPEVPAKVKEFCDHVKKIAIKHGGSTTKCEVIILRPMPKLEPPGIKV